METAKCDKKKIDTNTVYFEPKKANIRFTLFMQTVLKAQKRMLDTLCLSLNGKFIRPFDKLTLN